MRKHLVALVTAFFGVSAVHSATSTLNPDVEEASVYRCTRGDSVKYTNDDPKIGQACTKLFVYGRAAIGRPGLSTYRVLYYNADPVALYSTDRLDLAGNPRIAWVMLSYIAPLRHGEHAQPYTRMVAKFTVDCVHSTIGATSGYDFAVEGGRVLSVGPEPVWPVSEPLPATVTDSVLKHLCKLKIDTFAYPKNELAPLTPAQSK